MTLIIKKPVGRKNLISQYCRLRSHIDKLKSQESDLRERVLTEFDKLGPFVGSVVLRGHDKTAVRKTISTSYIITPLLFYNRTRPKDFLSCVTVSVSKAANFMSREDVIKISTPVEKISLKINI